MEPDSPIGIFDSGLGGLSVVKYILRELPGESIVYFADTAHLPYGPRPLSQIKYFALTITRFLVDEGAKLIVMGCNMSSAVALERAREDYQLPILGMIDAGVRKAVEVTKTGRVGVIGTEGTVKGKFYSQRLRRLEPDCFIFEQACPEFVPLVEAGELEGIKTKKLAERYLQPLKDYKIDTLILGCTHYPLLEPLIAEIVGEEIVLIDPAQEVVKQVKETLAEQNGLNPRNSPALIQFYATGSLNSLVGIGSRFLGIPIKDVTWLDFW